MGSQDRIGEMRALWPPDVSQGHFEYRAEGDVLIACAWIGGPFNFQSHWSTENLQGLVDQLNVLAVDRALSAEGRFVIDHKRGGLVLEHEFALSALGLAELVKGLQQLELTASRWRGMRLDRLGQLAGILGRRS